MTTETEIKNLLRSRELRATSTRLNLLREMKTYDSAMPYSVIQETLKDVDRVTLYRTLESLKDKGVIHKAFQENSEAYYALCDSHCESDHHHHDHIHFKCVKCNTVSCENPASEIKIEIPGVSLHQLNINAEGICKNCLSID